MNVSTFTPAAAESALEAARATWKISNVFQGLDADLDRCLSLLADEFARLTKMDLKDRGAWWIRGAVNYAVASAWIQHWPNRHHGASFKTQDQERTEKLREAQLLGTGAVLAAAAMATK